MVGAMTVGRVTSDISRRESTLRSSTIRDFSGGWNVIDSELVLSPRFATRLRNISRRPDGTLGVRYGTRLFSNLSDVLESDVVNMEYYNDFIVAVGESGMIAAVSGAGIPYRIWDESSANALPGRPAGWGDTSFVSFTQFKGKLLIGNGIDKPLIVNSAMHVDYLQDLATLVNAYTPIARLCATHGQFVVWAGLPGRPGVLSISAKGTSGTYVGDTAPNDAVEFDVSAYIAAGSAEITGLSSFRNRLIVTFDQNTVVVVLGEYVSGVHVPRVEDVIAEHGSVCHRSMQSLGNDQLYLDSSGVTSIKRALFTETIQPDQPSELIKPELQKDLSRLSAASLEDRVCSIYDKLAGQYMVFIPNTDNDVDTIETRGFVYTFIETLKVRAWSEFTEMNWKSVCRSKLGRVFFSNGSDIFIYGNTSDPIYADRVGAEEMFSDDTCFTDQTGFTPVTSATDSGVPIIFDWEQPWGDFERRGLMKTIRFLGLDVEGDARFTVQAFVDNLDKLRGDPGEEFTDDTFYEDDFGHKRFRDEQIRTPEAEMTFVGGDALGYGANFGNYYGGGRLTSEELLYEFPIRGKIIKLRTHGETINELRFVAITLFHREGGIRK